MGDPEPSPTEIRESDRGLKNLDPAGSWNSLPTPSFKTGDADKVLLETCNRLSWLGRSREYRVHRANLGLRHLHVLVANRR
jgi:hypothetical protein